jgi:N-methylhydantoinase A/oxoprolinase/acetone carboxylase beta subunit
MAPEQAALGAVSILTHAMVQAIELNSIRRGYDPRDFALVAFGGAGPLFACDIARELSIPAVVVPTLPGLTSALGLLTSDISYDFSRTLWQSLAAPDVARLQAAFAELEDRARGQLARDGFAPGDIAFLRLADCRYVGQGYELRVDAPAGPVDGGFVAALIEGFHGAHQRRYGSRFPDRVVQLVNIRVIGVGRIPHLAARPLAAGDATPPAAARIGTRPVVFAVDGRPQALEAAVWRREALLAGNVLRGPAIVEQMDTTTVVPPGLAARVDASGSIVIAIG